MIEQHQQGASDPAQRSAISAQQFAPAPTAHGAGKSEGAQLLPTSPATLPPSDEEQTPEGQMHLRKHSAILEKARQHEHAAETMVVPQERQIETSIKPSSPHTKNPNTSTAALAPLSRQAHSVAVPLSSGQLEERKRFGARLAWWGLIFLLVVLWWREITTFSLWWGTLGTIAGFTVGLFLLPAFPLLQGVKDDWAGGALSLFLLLIALGLFFYSLRETSRFLRALRAARQKIKRPLP